MNNINKLLKSKTPLRDILYFFEGTYRYWLFYRRIIDGVIIKHPLMREHIFEQILYRISIMNPVCFQQGSCIKCGCTTTAMQMASKTCGGLEYPPLVSRDKWRRYINCSSIIKQGSNIWMFHSGITDSYIETSKGYVFLSSNRTINHL